MSYGTSILWRIKNAGFPLTKPMAVNTVLRHCAACDVDQVVEWVGAYIQRQLEKLADERCCWRRRSAAAVRCNCKSSTLSLSVSACVVVLINAHRQ